MRLSLGIGLVLSVTLIGCGIFPERVSQDDARLTPMFDAVARVDRVSMGFTPISPDATIRLETGPRSGYDVMLHVHGKTSRAISFRRTDTGYEWIGEQEIFEGPRRHKTPDGEFNESITLTYDKASISGVPVGKLAVRYQGEDASLAWPRELSLEVVRPVLKQWGY
jgi:hypothetical protein